MVLVYNIVIEIKEDPFVIKRSIDSIEMFVNEVANLSDVGPHLSNLLQSVRKNENQVILSAVVEMALMECFKVSKVVESDAMATFLWDDVYSYQEKSDYDNETPLSALELLLQPFEYQDTYIPRLRLFLLDIKMEKGEHCVWQFYLAPGTDIEFVGFYRETTSSTQNKNDSVLRIMNDISTRMLDKLIENGVANAVEMLTKTRGCQQVPQEQSPHPTLSLASALRKTIQPASQPAQNVQPFIGSYSCSKSGILRLVWNNCFSRFTGKYLTYKLQVVSNSTMQV